MITEQQQQNERKNGFYIKRGGTEKECFKTLKRFIEDKVRSGKIKRICDVGCATGDLIAYLKRSFSNCNIDYCGIDVSDKLLEVAYQRLPDVEFIKFDISQDIKECAIVNSADVVTFFGVLTYFEDFSKVLYNLMSMVSPGGQIFVFGPFNQYGYKVKYQYTHYNGDSYVTDTEYTHSMEEISKWLQERGMSYNWTAFQMPFDIQPLEEKYSIRVWTERLECGKRIQRDRIDRIEEQFFLNICC